MPKMKTHRGAKKRLRITRTGKVLAQKGSRGHNKMKKKNRQLSAMNDLHEVSSPDAKRAKRLLPYGSD